MKINYFNIEQAKSVTTLKNALKQHKEKIASKFAIARKTSTMACLSLYQIEKDMLFEADMILKHHLQSKQTAKKLYGKIVTAE